MDIAKHFASNHATTSSLLTALLCLTTALHLLKWRNKKTFWDKLGLPSRVPLFQAFSELSHLTNHEDPQKDQEKLKKFGKIYGTYLSDRPELMLADPEVIQQIMIKDFDCFTDHGDHILPNVYQRLFLFFLKGDHWRKVRALMTPTFTSSKIKRMFNFFDGCADDLMDHIDSQNQQRGDGTGVEINTMKLFSLYTIDGFATCCYGLKLKREQLIKEQNQIKSLESNDKLKSSTTYSREKFVELSENCLNRSYKRIVTFMFLPTWLLKMFGVTEKPESVYQPLANFFKHLVQMRNEPNKSSRYDDLLQLLVDAKLSDQLEVNELDQAENHHASLTKNSILGDQEQMLASVVNPKNKASGMDTLKLSELEVISNALFLMVAGLETTVILLSFCTSILAYNPEVQERLYKELEKIAEFDSKKNKHIFDYESLTSCHYLDAVLSETLRLYPPANAIDRRANCSYHIKKYNVHIPKDFYILINIRGLHRSPEYWDEPDKFNPDRFLPENRNRITPGTYLPFGMGPRHCIGMRFSLTESKLGLARLIMKYHIRPAPNSTYPPKILPDPGLKKPIDPRVIFAERNNFGKQ